jgi:hypothetical protein
MAQAQESAQVSGVDVHDEGHVVLNQQDGDV